LQRHQKIHLTERAQGGGMGVNYPIYKKLLAQGKQKYAYEIMELVKEISEQ